MKKEEKTKFRKDFLIDFGANLQKIRKEKGFSQESLAHEIDFHRTYVGFLERGERIPSLFVLYQLAKILEVTPSRLVEF